LSEVAGLANLETGGQGLRYFGDTFHMCYLCEWRPLLQPVEKLLQKTKVALGQDFDVTTRQIADPPA
jgi:hypothetical protein